jgi:hypothetical protein
VFTFEFVNSYGALIYVAFLKSRCEPSEFRDNDCLMELSSAVGMLFGSAVVFGNVEEALTPMLERKFAALMDGGGDDAIMKSDAEDQFILADYDAEAIFDDYAVSSIGVSPPPLLPSPPPLTPPLPP